MRLSLAKLLITFLLIFVTYSSAAAPPVIWFGNDAKFLNSGTIIVPGLGLGVVHSSSTGVFSSSTVLPSEVSGGTANRFAYFDSLGVLASLNNWVKNSFGGADVNQTPSLTDPGSSGSMVLNNRDISITTTNNLANTVVYSYLDTINLGSSNDYSEVKGREFFMQQTGVNNITSDLVVDSPRLQLGVGGVGSTSQNDYVHNANVRSSGNHTSNSLNAYRAQVSTDGGTTTNDATSFLGTTYVGGTAQYVYGLNQTVQAAGTVGQQMYGGLISMFADGGSAVQNAVGLAQQFSGNVVNNYTGLSAGIAGDVGGNYAGISVGQSGTITADSSQLSMFQNGNVLGNSRSIYTNNGGNVTGGLNMLETYNSGTVGGGFRHLAASNNGNVSNFSAGIVISDNNTVTKGQAGFAYYHTGNIGDGTGTSANLLDGNFNSGTIDGNVFLVNGASNATITGGIFGLNMSTNGPTLGTTGGAGSWGLNWNNSADFSATNAGIILAQLNNQGPGFRLQGISVVNNQNMVEESKGFHYNDSGNSRTKTGVDIAMSGNATDDVTALRIQMNSQTSTNQRPQSINTAGGVIGIQSEYSPISGIGFDIGNNITATDTINTALTGTDQIIQLIQSNLIVHDDIAMGPFGVGVNMTGVVPQLAVDSGKTIPLLRSMILGTTVPGGSGGTLAEHHVLGLLGLPSSGGSITNPIRMGIIDEVLFGQNFCDGATDCWFIKNQDGNSENHLARLAINTTNKKTSTNVKLEVKDGHVKSDQTTAPVATVNANAGTSATCSVSGATDTAGTVELVTGSAAWASGAQCAIVFNTTYNVAPKCVLSPINANAAAAALSVYTSKTTTGLTLNFANADTAATTYQWDYYCEETY